MQVHSEKYGKSELFTFPGWKERWQSFSDKKAGAEYSFARYILAVRFYQLASGTKILPHFTYVSIYLLHLK